MRTAPEPNAEAMVAIAGGGHNTYSRYERAEVAPPRALWVLLTLIQQVGQIAARGGENRPPGSREG